MLKDVFDPKALVGVALLAILAVPQALAVTFNVNSTLDQPDDLTIPGTCHTAAGTCTLRAAVMQANRTSGLGATIILQAGTYTLTIPATGADDETNGDLNLTTPASGSPTITIAGAGASTTNIDANQLDRVFHVHSNRMTTLSGVTIRNGFRSGVNPFGCGIWNEGSLAVSNAAITGNHCTGSGGGILNDGNLTVTNSTISQNIADLDGAGIRNDIGPMLVLDSTVSQNNAGRFGGGIYNAFGTLTVNRSTIFGNNAATDGGGILNTGNLALINSTISQNNANNNGGGIYNHQNVANVYNTSIVFNGADADADPGGGSAGGVFNNDANGATFNLRNTLVAGNNVQGAPVYDDCTGTLNSFGRNLFWSVIAGCTVVNGAGGSWTTLNALNTLGPLQNNGGPTLTHALLTGSNAIDGGDPVSGCVDNTGTLTTDQRGAPRVAGVRCDIGAYEYNAATTPIFQSAVSRRVHGAAGTFDLPLSAVTTNPTTEPRQGPAQAIVLTFDKPLTGATATITEGTATAAAPTISGNSVIVGLTGVTDEQYVTISLTNVSSSDGGTGGTGSVRVGFLLGDVNQNRVVTVADLGLVNAQLAQLVTAANFLKDVNANGTLTVADKGITNSSLTKALPPP